MSFKDAALELAITPSAVSHQIRNLESLLGVLLFNRLTRSLELTDAGRKYFAFLDSMFLRLESETQQVSAHFGRRIVRLCVPPFFASEALLPRLRSFQGRSPATDIRVTTRPSAMKTHPSEADVSILLGNSEWPDYVTHRLFDHWVVVACSESYLKNHNLESYEDLDGKTLIAHDSRPNAWDDWASKVGIGPPTPGRLIRSDSMSSIVRAAQQGLGIALVSWPLGRNCFGPGLLSRVFDKEIDSGESFYFAYREEDSDRPEVGLIRTWILDQFENYT